jgi:hypothetical protein
MSELKTKPNDLSVTDFLSTVSDEKRKKDCLTVSRLMKDITDSEPMMWGNSIVGFGSYHYKYESGREGDWFLAGFSPHKQNLTLYIVSDFKKYDELLKKLGKYKTGKACLYINKLEDVNMEVLKELITASVDYLKKNNK